MNKELDFEIEELGVATVETQGALGVSSEAHNQQIPTGISDAD